MKRRLMVKSKLQKIFTQASTISDLLQMQPDEVDDSDTSSCEQLKDKELRTTNYTTSEGWNSSY